MDNYDSIQNGILVIGICGVSNGGKTTISKLIKELLDKHVSCHIIGQDDYYKDEKDIEVDAATGVVKWDVVEAFYMERLCSDVESFISAHAKSSEKYQQIETVLIIEGILIYHERKLNKYFNKRYFLTLPYAEAESRRSERVYEPPDVPQLFDAHVWPMYEKHRKILLDADEDMLEIDATQGLDEVFFVVKLDLQQSFWPNETWLDS